MSLLESLRIALNGLITNRLRSMLTTLGIVIGVGAVIALISLGRGVEGYVARSFQGLGSNVLFVFSSVPANGTVADIERISTKEGEALDDSAVAPSIRQIAMEFGVGAQVLYGAKASNMLVSGVTPNFAEVRTWLPREGAFISEDDVENVSRVAVLGTTIVERLFGDKTLNPIGEVIRINQRVFTVIGVMEEKAPGFIGDENEVVFIPISTAQTRLDRARTRDGGYRVDVLHIEAVSEDMMDSATLEVETYLSDAHEIAFQGQQDFTIINQADLLSSLGQVTGILTVFLGMIAGISLLVGGIGIMNIMLVSVTERTREIGLRKAVGARAGDILLQFLIESVVLSILGGLLGIVFGGLMTVLGGLLVPDLTLVLTTDAILLATLVSSGIGIFFGLYPASRAARMRPIDALRFE